MSSKYEYLSQKRERYIYPLKKMCDRLNFLNEEINHLKGSANEDILKMEEQIKNARQDISFLEKELEANSAQINKISTVLMN